MMKNRLTLRAAFSLLLIAIFMVFMAACAPAERASTSAPAEPAPVEPSATPSSAPVEGSTPAVDLTATYLPELLSATPPVDAQPVATSRGPDLHATDPATVSLASGGLQFVEFFRFT